MTLSGKFVGHCHARSRPSNVALSLMSLDIDPINQDFERPWLLVAEQHADGVNLRRHQLHAGHRAAEGMGDEAVDRQLDFRPLAGLGVELHLVRE